MMKLFGGKKDTPEHPVPEAGPAETPKSGLFSRMKQAVSRTRESLSSRIETVIALTRTVDESTLNDLETVLLSSDLGVQTTTAILEALRDRARRQAIEGGDELRDLLKAQIRAILEAPIANQPSSSPSTALTSPFSLASTEPAKPPPPANWPPGIARKTAPFCSAPPTHSAQRPSSSLKFGPRAPASK